MRKQILYCDKCKQEFGKKDMALVNYTISKFGETPAKLQVDLCRECYLKAEELWAGFINEDDQQGSSDENATDAIVGKGDFELKKGPISRYEEEIIIIDYINKVSTEQTASKIHKSIVKIRKVITDLEDKHGILNKDNPYVKSIMNPEDFIDTDNMDEESLSAGSRKHGPISPEEETIIVTDYANGKSVTDIASKLNRTDQGIWKTISSLESKYGILKMDNPYVRSILHPEKACMGEEPLSDDFEYVSGPIKDDERNSILILYAQGKTLIAIAKETHRVPRAINRVVNDYRRKYRRDLTLDNLIELGIIKSDVGKDEDSSSEVAEPVYSYNDGDEAPIGTGRKVDVGGIWALHNAGWSRKDIANEVHQPIEIVNRVLDRKG